MFCSLNIRYVFILLSHFLPFTNISNSCDAQGLKQKKKGEGPPADQLLFQAVQSYFVNGSTDFDSKVRLTSLPPIYFQHPGTFSLLHTIYGS